MFWERFYEQCLRNNTKPNPIGTKIGVSSGVITKWKNGTIPNGETLIKLADELHCSIDYLLGRTDVPDLIVKQKEGSPDIIEMPSPPVRTYIAKIAASDGSLNTELTLTDDDLKHLSTLPDLDEDI